MRFRLSLLVIALGLVGMPSRAQAPATVATPRGAPIEVIAEKPAGHGPFPAVILASGSGYDMRQAILAEVAKRLLSQGFAVYRFNWAYIVAGKPFSGQPKDRKAELEDIQAVIALARKDSHIDRSRIAIAGKSLGSIIAWQTLRRDSELKGAILLTPVCKPDVVTANYPGLDTDTRPRLWLLGDEDPACPVADLERHVAAGGQGDRIAVISGDHSYKSPAHPERDERAFDLMLALSADFAATLLTPSKPAEK